MQMSSSLLFPSISPQNLSIFEASESLRSSNSVCFMGFKHGIRGFGLRNLDKSRAFMSVSVGSQTAANDAFFLDYKPISAFLFPGQPAIYVTSLAVVEVIHARDGGQQIIDSVNVTCGLSLGEYTALAFAGAFRYINELIEYIFLATKDGC